MYSAFIRSILLYGNEIWLVKEEDMIRLTRSDPRMVKWILFRPEDRISAKKRRAGLTLKSMRKCLQKRKLQWFKKFELVLFKQTVSFQLF